jgi:hypothetical protein
MANGDQAHVKITLPIGLLIAAIIFGGSFLATWLNQSKDVAVAMEHNKVQDVKLGEYSNRLTALEIYWKSFCEDMNDLKSTIKEVQRDQRDFYKSRGFTPKESGK